MFKTIVMNLRKDFTFDNALLKNFTNLTEKEVEVVRQMRNHESVRIWMYHDHLISEKEHHEYLLGLKNNNRCFAWLVINKTNNEPMGVINLRNVDFTNKNTFYGIYANPLSMNLGIGRLLDQLSIKVAFDILKLHTLKLEVIESNKQVINLHKKMGFQEEGRLKDFVMKDGKWKDVIIMGITDKETRCND